MRVRPITAKRIGAPMPAHPYRVHVKWSSPICDQFALLNRAAFLPQRRRRADINVCATRDGEVGAHWPKGPEANGYRYIIDGKRRRKMTHAELHRPLIKWDIADVLRWRKTKRAIQRHGRHRPHTIPQWQAAARRRRVLCMYELKSPEFREPERAARMAAQVRASGWPAWVMKLATQAHWREIVRAYHDAAFWVGLLTENIAEPDDWPKWAPYVDRLLGKFTHPKKGGRR